MSRKTSISIAAALLAAPIMFASPAMGTEDVCVPTPAVEAVFEIKLHTWTGGPSETAPPVDSPDWNQTNGDPQGGPHAEAAVGVAYQTNDNGNSNWFLKLNVEVSPAIPAVECPPVEPTPTPEPTNDGEDTDTLPDNCPDVVDPSVDAAIQTVPDDCPVTLPKPDQGEVCCAIDKEPADNGSSPGDNVQRPPAPELPATGSEDSALLVLAGLGLIGLGVVVYVYGRRP